MAGSSYFWFRIPTLPRDVYRAMMAFRERTGLSQWQIVILGVQVLATLEDTEVAPAVARVKQQYPASSVGKEAVIS